MSETQEQIALFKWAAQSGIKELELMYHIPNGGSRRTKESAILRAAGVKAGIPDVCLSCPKGPYHGMYIEMKTDGGRISKAQSEVMQALKSAGYYVVVCYGWENAREEIGRYLLLEGVKRWPQ